ncbi:MAG: thioredoxin family protein, partial [Bacteroidia bacterium]|nr:thioredoxin family protein [Bacteroidia bacterium]
FMKEFYFEKWNFSEELLLSNPFLSNRIMRYLRDFTDIYNYAGIQYSVDKLLKATKSQNSKVFDFMWNFLVKLYLHSGLEKVAIHIYDTYLESCSNQITNASEEIQKLETLKKLQPGNPAPLIPLEKQGLKKFDEVIRNHELVILYFWASTCDYCRKYSPELLKVVSKTPKNIGVITISLDKDKSEWQKYLHTLQADKWYHYCDLQGWQSDIVKNYAIRKTPVCYLIDRKGNIIEREVHPLDIEKFLLKYFNSKS